MAFLVEALTDPKKNAAVAELEFCAKDLGCTLPQFAIAWCAKNPNVSSVITGASRVEQVRENLKALDFVPKITPPMMERVERIVAGLAD
jgi:aryl-alcohol dehydrogenase-like predicted oxidoreductase